MILQALRGPYYRSDVLFWDRQGRYPQFAELVSENEGTLSFGPYGPQIHGTPKQATFTTSPMVLNQAESQSVN